VNQGVVGKSGLSVTIRARHLSGRRLVAGRCTGSSKVRGRLVEIASCPMGLR